MDSGTLSARLGSLDLCPLPIGGEDDLRLRHYVAGRHGITLETGRGIVELQL